MPSTAACFPTPLADRREISGTRPRGRAETHATPHVASAFAWLVLGLGTTACSGEGEAARAVAGGSAASAAADIQALIEAFQPVDPVATSDVHDQALARQREVLERLRGGEVPLGKAAYAAFRAHERSPDLLRAALLNVAARCDPLGMAPVLETMILTYDPRLGLGLRTQAVEFLAEADPARAQSVFEPLLRDERVVGTLPPRETLVRAWAAAARALGGADLRLLCDVAVDIAQPQEARVAAVGELATFGGRPAAQALETVLFEAASDAYLRRKAAQSLAQFLPPAELCPLIERASAHEHDTIFLRFLGDLAAAHCP
jgi:hypothetical protein